VRPSAASTTLPTMLARPRSRKPRVILVIVSSLAVLASLGCAATHAGSSVNRERDIKMRFSQNHFCPDEQISVTGDGTHFSATGCGKSSSYSCFEPSDDSSRAGFVCSDSARTPGRNEPEQRPQSLNHPEMVPPGPTRRP
jgi:hypothetical protein